MNNYDNTIFEEFLNNFRYVNGHVDKWYPISEDCIIVKDDEGWYHKYDALLRTDTCSKNLASVLTFEVTDKKTWLNNFSKSIYRAILKSGYTQDMLSWDAKVGSGSISHYVNGERIPSIYNLLKVANTIGCTTQDIMNMLCVNRNAGEEIPNIEFIFDKEEWTFEFSIRLIRLLRRRKINQHEFAERIDVSPTAVSMYVKGTRIPSAYVISCIIREFDLTVDEIKYLLLIL